MGLFDQPMKPKEYERWSRQRAHGMWYFVGVFGVVCWGLTAAVVGSVVTAFLSCSPFSASAFLRSFVISLGRALIQFPLAGLLMGLGMWFYAERRFAKTKPPDSPTPGTGPPAP